MISAQLKSGHRDKILGHFWSLLDPLLTLAVYYLVFGIGFRQAGERPIEFVLYLFAGIVAWRFFGETVGQASGALRSHRSLILSADFPKAVIPISICGARLYDLLWALVVVIAVAAFAGSPPTLALLWLPLLILIQAALTLGLSFIVAYSGLFFADTANIVTAFLRLWVLACPIFYFAKTEHGRTGIIPDSLIDYYMLNPIAGLLGAYRSVLIWGKSPDAGELGYVIAFAAVLLLAGFALFNRGEGRFAKFV
ncbi:MAG: ABC transporter permease [Myxococcota bacterium]